MDQWRKEIVTRFGKRGGRRWLVAATDIQLVDIGVKSAVLFDHWSISATDMQAFVIELHKQGLIRECLGVLAVGLDVVIYNYKSFDTLLPETQLVQYFVDVTSSLGSAVILDSRIACDTTIVFSDFCECLRRNKEDTLSTVYEVKITERLNVPCLFGLLLGYPCVYWYDRTIGEENCLSGQTLHLFQVKSLLDVKDKSFITRKQQSSKSDSCQSTHITHNILSFSVPENLIDLVGDGVHEWFSEWKESKCWLQMFSDVWLEEDIVNPQAVCL